MVATFIRDIRLGARTLRRNPLFALVAILTLGAGIGANTAIFSALDALLLHPLPYHHPDQLMLVTKNMPKFELEKSDASALDFLDYRNLSTSFSHMAGLQTNSVNLTGGEQPMRLFGLRVSASLFPMLGVQPAVGRIFRPDEEQPGKDRVALLTTGLWQSRFGGDPRIAGKTIHLDGESFTVIGVVDPVLQFMEVAQIYVPLALTPAQLDPHARGRQNIDVIARIRPGVTLEQARAEMKVVAARMTRNLPDWYPPDWSIDLDPLAQSVAGELRTPLLVLMTAVGAVLLIACTNVANLLLARAASRRREVGIRTALGAARRQIMAQLLSESLVLALLAGAAGLSIAAWMLDLFTRLAPSDLLRWQVLTLNGSVAAFTFGLSLVTTLLFGLAPAILASRVEVNDALKEGSRNAGSRQGGRLRGFLVVSEVALSLVLLIGASLLIRSFVRLEEASPGFRTDHLLTARISLPALDYREPARITAFYSDLRSRMAALPGVTSAAFVDGLPFGAGGGGGSFGIVGHPWPASEPVPDVERRIAAPGYFATMGIPLKQGRTFTDRDADGAQPIAVVDEPFARAFFPKGDAIGHQLTAPDGKAYEIVGVVGGHKDRNLMLEPRPMIYYPALQRPARFVNLVIRTAGDPMSVVPAIQRHVRELDPNLPVYKMATMGQVLADALVRRRLSTWLLAILAGFAMILAALGIYGVVAYAVGQRTAEIGIRMALGAEAGDVRSMVLNQALRPVLVGIAIGLGAAAAVTRLLASLLYQTSAVDALTFSAVPAVLLIVAAAAIHLPVRRATRVDPMTALRYE